MTAENPILRLYLEVFEAENDGLLSKAAKPVKKSDDPAWLSEP